MGGNACMMSSSDRRTVKGYSSRLMATDLAGWNNPCALKFLLEEFIMQHHPSYVYPLCAA